MPYLTGGALFLRICRAEGGNMPSASSSQIDNSFSFLSPQFTCTCSLVVCHWLLPCHPTRKSQPQLNFSQSQEIQFPFAANDVSAFYSGYILADAAASLCPSVLGLQVHVVWCYPRKDCCPSRRNSVCAYAHLTSALLFADSMQPSSKTLSAAPR